MFAHSWNRKRIFFSVLVAWFVVESSWAQVTSKKFDYHTVRGRTPKQIAEGRFEGEEMEMTGTSRPQPMSGFGKQWSDNGQLLWDGPLEGSMTTSFDIESKGRFDIEVQLTLAPDYGVFELLLNGESLKKEIDLYDPKVKLAPLIKLTDVELEAGEQSLAFKLTGKNEKAFMIPGERLLMGLDFVHLTRTDAQEAPPSRIEEMKPRTAGAESTLRRTVSRPMVHGEFHLALEKHCYECHSGDVVEGDISLDQLVEPNQLLAAIKTTQRIRNVVLRHEMPPEDSGQPTAEIRSRMVATLDGVIDQYLAEHRSDVPVIMRRMNRYEFSNSVRDLLSLRGDIYPMPEKTIRADASYFDPASGRFPKSVIVGNRTLGKNQVEKQFLTGVSPFAIDLQAEGGFNNRGSDLSISPILLESFLKLGRSIVLAPEFNQYCGDYEKLFLVSAETTSAEQVKIADDRLRRLLERAFRTPVEDDVVARYLDYFRSQRKRKSFEASMKNVVAAILASPKFIYISESSGDQADELLNAWELATRLSFFLWSTIPDEELLAAARDGSLIQMEVLEAQVTRMLEHPKSQALSQNFARQWLRLDQLVAAVPDFDRYEAYYARIGCEQWKLGLQSMLEPLLLFESIMVEDRSVMLLIDSNYTYRSKELQSWYTDAVPFAGNENRNRFNTNQQQFRRTKLSDRREGGVITTAATLTMTSAPLRTSPIIRGAWVATCIFNQPPPPPPDDVPSIEADEKAIEAKGLTLRERLVQHQENESCASCHSKIDPLGFALENYDAVGRWRNEYGSGLKIDSSGTLFGEAKFRDVVGLKDAILERPEWFIRPFCEHLLSYALTRELEVSDEKAIENIVTNVLADRGQFSTIIGEIVRSHPFRYHGGSTLGHNKTGGGE